MELKNQKGKQTRMAILEQARVIYNKKGIYLTLDKLASAIKIPKARITNHFSTKDKLFLAILAEYEDILGRVMEENKALYESPQLADQVAILGKIMDIQYEYRSAILYLTVFAQGQDELRAHVKQTFQRNRLAIRKRLERLVNEKVIRPQILEPPSLESFMFIYVNTVTQWITYFDMYDGGKQIEKAKKVYLKSIMEHVYGPYLTSKGKKQLANIFPV